MALLGYARTSTHDQQHGLDDQVTALDAAGCGRVWSEHGSGARDDRPELAALLDYAREGDVIVVTALDRLGRSLSHLVSLVNNDLRVRGVGLRSLREGIDTSNETGMLTFHIFGAIAEFELSLVRSRTRAGLRAAAEHGRTPGRKPKLSAEQVQMAKRLYQEGEHTVADIAAMLGGVGRSTIYRALEIKATRTADTSTAAAL